MTNPQEKIKENFHLIYFLIYIFQKVPVLYNEWLSKGYINETFSANFTQERDYAFILIGGDQDDYHILQKDNF